MAELVIATKPDPDSRLPYVVRVPYGDGLAPAASAVSSAEIRAWARMRGLTVSERGRIAKLVVDAFWAANPGRRPSAAN